MIIYLEYSRKLPHNGGELIYVCNSLIVDRRKTNTMSQAGRNPLGLDCCSMSYTPFILSFLQNTATKSMQVANQILTCAAGRTSNYSPDPRSLRFIAIVALSYFCLLHYFSGRAGRDLMQILAIIKIGFMEVLFSAGCARAKDHYTPDWTQDPNPSPSSSAQALLYIKFSFYGWENASKCSFWTHGPLLTYVIGR
jgi:amino acid transporter